VTELQRALLHELVAADEVLAVELDELESLAGRTAAIRARADELAELLASAESVRERNDHELAVARSDVAERETVLRAAEADVAEAAKRGDPERQAEAGRFETRARDALTAARRRVEVALEERDRFRQRVAEAEADVPVVEQLAAALASELAGRPRLAGEAGKVPPPGLLGVIEWTSAARAALFVARTAVATEREALIRQANELGSAILGESLYAANPAVVAARVGASPTR